MQILEGSSGKEKEAMAVFLPLELAVTCLKQQTVVYKFLTERTQTTSPLFVAFQRNE